MNEDGKICMGYLRIVITMSLIIIFISIAQLCNKEEYGYKSLHSIDPNITTIQFRKLINKRIKLSKSINIINIIFNMIIYFYFNIRINPVKHLKFCLHIFINIIFICLTIIGISLNSLAISNFKKLKYKDDFFIINNELKYNENAFASELFNKDVKDSINIEVQNNNINTNVLFNNGKNDGSQNLKFDATILSFNIIQFLIISYSTCLSNNTNDYCPMDCGDCWDLFFTSENSLNREIIKVPEYSNKSSDENKKLKKDIEKLQKNNENLENKIKQYKKDKQIFFLIKYYIKQKHNQQISSEHMKEILIKEINKEFKENIQLNNIKKIAIIYIKEKLEEYLTCPISNDIFSNPYIAPEGQTFDKMKIYESLEKNKLNPITRNPLKKEKLKLNKKVLDLVELYNDKKDNFDEETCSRLKFLLKNEKTNKYYENPTVLSSGENIGITIEEKSNKYKNIIIKSLIEDLKDILDEYIPNMDKKKGNKLLNGISYRESSEDLSISEK